mmetsp:Transcript_519/g.1439  ORF Transcript_519/g.1439 Transcript_519/m.1439 type:complete len:287 (-) Transcript_519:23-883(-)
MFKDAKARLFGAEGVTAFEALVGDDDHLARFNLADKFRPDDVKGAGFRAEHIAGFQLAQNQRTYTQCIAHADQFGARHGHNGKRAFDPAQRVFHPFGNVALQRPRHQMDDAFAVGRALEDGPAFDQLAAQGVCICDVPIMGNGRTAHGKFAKEGLNIADRGLALQACRGIAHMADGQLAGQRFHNGLRREVVAHITKAPGGVKAVIGVVGHNPPGLLSAMLQGVQAEGHEIGSIIGAKDAKDPAFLFEFIVITEGGKVKGMRGRHACVGSVGQWAAPNPVLVLRAV